ncbi:hypothetical protein MMC26_002560 [Xylographa opegraphella]|nr:hypothetical protein [Xylographa opegraphella]
MEDWKAGVMESNNRLLGHSDFRGTARTTNRPWEVAFPGVPGIGRPHQSKASDPPLELDVDPPTLKGTSQGPKTIAPPEHWIEAELVKFDALKTPGIYIMDLEECQYLEPERFDMPDHRRKALGQGIALLGLLLETSAAYFANVFPREPNFFYMDGAPNKQRVVMNENLDKRERVFTFEYLMAYINTHVTFRESRDLYATRGRLALIHPAHIHVEDVPLDSCGFDNHMTKEWHKAANRGIQRKDWYHHVTITFATDFADTYLANKKGSEERLIATVSAATVFVHHIAYASRLAHVKGHRNEKFKRWVGLDVEFDDGYALEGWLFGGVCAVSEPFFPIQSRFLARRHCLGNRIHAPHDPYFEDSTYPRKFLLKLELILTLEYKPSGIPHEPGFMVSTVELSSQASLGENGTAYPAMSQLSKCNIRFRWLTYNAGYVGIIENLLAPKTPFRLGRCARIGWYPVPWRLDKDKTGFIPNPWLYSTLEGPCPFVDLDWDDAEDTQGPVNPAAIAKAMAKAPTPKKRVNPSAPPKPNFIKRLLATKAAKTRTDSKLEPYSDWWYERGIKRPSVTREQRSRANTILANFEGNKEDVEHVMALVADETGKPFLPRDPEEEEEGDPLFPETSEWDG